MDVLAIYLVLAAGYRLWPYVRRLNPGLPALLVSLCLILITALQWYLMDGVGFFLVPMFLILLWLAFVIVGLWGVVHLLRHWRDGYRAFLPTFVLAIAFGILWTVPFTSLWLDYYFSSHRNNREDIVRQVYNNTLQPNVAHNVRLIALDPNAPYVSMGGNQIIVEEHDGKKYVFFFTFRGFLDNYSGFLYVPDGGHPTRFSDLNETASTQLVRYDEHWYFAGHR